MFVTKKQAGTLWHLNESLIKLEIMVDGTWYYETIYLDSKTVEVIYLEYEE